jgi:hypothetical protein
MLCRPICLGFALAALAGVSSSCKAAPPAPAPSPLAGTFDFAAYTPRGEIRGVLRIRADTITVEFALAHGSCQEQPLQPNPLMEFRYQCADIGDWRAFTLAVDRRRGLLGSRWSGSYQVEGWREVCVEYITDAQGQRVCVRTERERYETTEYGSGVVNLRPRASAPS